MIPGSDRLDGWKAIAEYLDKSIRTVQTWANADGLPVRKLGGRAVAFKSELDLWVRNASVLTPVEVVEAPDPGARARATPSRASTCSLRRHARSHPSQTRLG
jgi:phage terminase Nu1 subunit (DNA packaging protein)